MNYWILLTILIASIVGVFVLFVMQKKKKDGSYKEQDYRAFFVMGICFLPMGIIFATSISPAFIGIIVLGLLYMIIGLANRDKWIRIEE